MSTETPQQRRTRLIEEYTGRIYAEGKYYSKDAIFAATQLADAVIAATPQEPQSELQQDIERRRAEIKTKRELPPHPLLRLDGYPSEIETRLIELVEHCIKGIYDVKRSQAACLQLAAIKRDLGLL